MARVCAHLPANPVDCKLKPRSTAKSSSARFLDSAKSKLNKLFLGNCSNEEQFRYSDALRGLLSAVEDLSGFLQPCHRVDANKHLRTYEYYVYKNRDVGAEAELANLLVELQNEASEAVIFLENVDLMVKCTRDILSMDLSDQGNLFISQKTEYDRLLVEKNAAQNLIKEQERKIVRLCSELDACRNELAKWESTIESDRESLRRHKYTGSVDLTDDAAIATLSSRLNCSATLLNAMKASPIKVVEEGSDFIVYEYTTKNKKSMITVNDQSGGPSFSLEPYAQTAHKYISQHIKKCKNRSEIAAIIQEAFIQRHV